MTLEEIRAEVEIIALEPSFSQGDYDRVINEAMLEVAARVIIPDLKMIDVVLTVADDPVVNYVTLTGVKNGFSGVLRRVNNGTTGETVEVVANLEALYDAYPDWNEAGDVEAVALEGRILWYQKVPVTAQSLVIMYTTNPDTLIEDDDETIFPKFLCRKLLVNGAARLIWDQIETDIEKPKVQTMFHTQQFEDGIVKYMEHLAKTKRHVITSCWSI